MDPATSQPSTMDKKNSQKASQNSKLYQTDKHNKDLHRKPNGEKRKSRNGVAEVGDGGQQRKAGRGGWGRATNRFTRNREKEGGQVTYGADWSLDDGDDDLYSCPEYHLRGGGSGKKESSRSDITKSLQSWFERDQHHHGSGRGGGARKKNYSGSRKCSADKLWQARCQFVVNRDKESKLCRSDKLPVGFSASTDGASGAAFNAGLVNLTDDPDDKVEWNAVEEVILHLTLPTNCPVCLYPPVAPQVTRCGHVYCYPCILHYLALSDKKGRSCPICYESVELSHLRSAVLIEHADFGVGAPITLVLMKRSVDSMIPLPVDSSLRDNRFSSAKKIRATKHKVAAIIDRELTALEVQLSSDAGAPEACFIEQAIALVKAKELLLPHYDDVEIQDICTDASECLENLKLTDNTEKSDYFDVPAEMCSNRCKSSTSFSSTDEGIAYSPSPPPLHLSSPSVSIPGGRNRTVSMTSSSGSLSESSSVGSFTLSMGGVETDSVILQHKDEPHNPEQPCIEVSQTCLKQGETVPEVLKFSFEKEDKIASDGKPSSGSSSSVDKSSKAVVNAPKSVHYFYQAMDGGNVFLCSMNLSMLVTEFGNVENCPLSITGQILEKDYLVMNDSQRHKTKYLRHLPLFCPFETVEVDLRPPFVSQQTLQGYRETLLKRQRQRRARAAEERKIERRNLALQEKEFSACLFKRVDSAAKSISMQSEVSPSADPVLLDQHFPQMGSNDSKPAASPVQSNSQTPQAPPSFANMLRVTSSQKTSPWPSLGGSNTSSPAVSSWGKSSTKPSACAWNSASPKEDEEENENFNAPDYRQAFNQGLDVLFSDASSGQKKKKNKKGKWKHVPVDQAGLW